MEIEEVADARDEANVGNRGAGSDREIFLPGDCVFHLDNFISKSLYLGPGIAKNDHQLLATRCGTMQYKPPSTFFVDPLVESYSPAVGDDVIGLIIRRKGLEVSEHYYSVGLGQNVERRSGVLPVLAFKGATKRFRPNLQKGDLVYCRITRVTKNGPTRLTCTSDNQGQECWGPLRRTGSFYRASGSFVKRCLTAGCAENGMISEIGEKIGLESAIGVNGRIWMYTGFEKSQNLVYQLFRDAELANGDGQVISRLTKRAILDICTLSQDTPLEDNTQYWITRVA